MVLLNKSTLVKYEVFSFYIILWDCVKSRRRGVAEYDYFSERKWFKVLLGKRNKYLLSPKEDPSVSTFASTNPSRYHL